MTDLEQLVLDFDAPAVAKYGHARYVEAGPAKLLRKLVVRGLDPAALDAAAELVTALDEEPAA